MKSLNTHRATETPHKHVSKPSEAEGNKELKGVSKLVTIAVLGLLASCGGMQVKENESQPKSPNTGGKQSPEKKHSSENAKPGEAVATATQQEPKTEEATVPGEAVAATQQEPKTEEAIVLDEASDKVDNEPVLIDPPDPIVQKFLEELKARLADCSETEAVVADYFKKLVLAINTFSTQGTVKNFDAMRDAIVEFKNSVPQLKKAVNGENDAVLLPPKGVDAENKDVAGYGQYLDLLKEYEKLVTDLDDRTLVLTTTARNFVSSIQKGCQKFVIGSEDQIARAGKTPASREFFAPYTEALEKVIAFVKKLLGEAPCITKKDIDSLQQETKEFVTNWKPHENQEMQKYQMALKKNLSDYVKDFSHLASSLPERFHDFESMATRFVATLEKRGFEEHGKAVLHIRKQQESK